MPERYQRSTTIAVIGGGLSGTLTAANLLRTARSPLRVLLIERRKAVGRGVAYSTGFMSHLLNVPAGKMSAWPHDPDHFLSWIQAHNRLPGATCGTFAPRKLYGDYIEDVLQEAEWLAEPGVQLKRVHDEAIGIQREEEQGRVVISLKDGRVMADRVVIAGGNLPPSDPYVADPTFYHSHRYVHSPWSPSALSGLRGSESLLLIGSGLTMLDLISALAEQGHHGPIHVISRHGLLPQSHQATRAYPAFLEIGALPRTTRELVRRVRAELRTAAEAGVDWRAVLDSMRPLTQAIWQALPIEERRRFLRHLRCYWETYRHRAPQEVMVTAEQMRATGQLTLHAGRLDAFREQEECVNVSYTSRHERCGCSIRVERVINCTGPCSNYLKEPHPLLASMLEQGMIRSDALKLGLDTAPDGALICAGGQVSDCLYTLGPTRKGTLWETTAAPEIRCQAAELARLLLDSLKPELSELLEPVGV